MGFWFICIILISAVDGSKIGEVHSPYSQPLEDCANAITMETAQVQDGIAYLYECHKSEDISA